MLARKWRRGVGPEMEGTKGVVRVKKLNATLLTLATATMLLTGCSPEYVVLNPVGPVGKTELHLIILSTILVAIVIIPVIILLAFIVYRYRDKPGNKAPYQPDWADSKKMEFVWWAIPIVIIGILGTVTGRMTYSLMQPPEKNATPLTIEVTSLDWKWLFQYPGEKVATVNYADIPVGRPVQFVLTSDAPMNSFWVPQLGGQEYSMPGMSMGLWLQADKAGNYTGRGANFTGKGFAHNTFHINAVSQAKFDAWVSNTKRTASPLTMKEYNQLAKPSLMGTKEYSSFPADLYSNIIQKDSGMKMGSSKQSGNMAGMNMSGMNMNSMDMSPKN